MNTPSKTPPKPWSEMSDGEQAEVRRKIAAGGFGTELKARRLFAEAGFRTIALDYLDKDERVTREVDILGVQKGSEKYSERPKFIHLIVAEVKSHHIWVAGDDSRLKNAEPSVVRFAIPSWFRAERPASTSEGYALDSDYLEGFRLQARTTATSFFQVKEKDDKKDALYEACTAVVKGIEAIGRPEAEANSGAVENPNFYVVVPLVILDGNLLGVTYGDDGQFDLAPREHVQRTFSFGTPNYTRKDTCIHIVTLGYLPTFLQKVVNSEKEATALAGKLHQRLHQPLPI